ncbi:MAG: hypothetical protein JSR75_19715 [Proteobacteria bacterium]|nr:hypothetical protein [Pseudomonadota bacterium]
MTFLAFLALVAAVVCWFSSTLQNAYIDVYKAGLLQPHWSAKLSTVGALLGAFICAAGTPGGALVNLAVVTACASFACGGYVLTLALAYGLDSRMAEAMRTHYRLAQTVLPQDELKDPVKLQAYLDRCYGKGRVEANELLSAKAAA